MAVTVYRVGWLLAVTVFDIVPEITPVLPLMLRPEGKLGLIVNVRPVAVLGVMVGVGW